ncbi:DUF6850 family outer membrane beta-barrel protein [Saccharicrinis sp. GN24d3]|uniref:DUF6850 family outer membrane beta-barrel protein n=1 Tax=Saccharicrinis sp. GN24d3 TaxID=3458416 RepID=UPI00403696BA
MPKNIAYIIRAILGIVCISIQGQQVKDLAYVSFWNKAMDSTQFANPALMDGLHQVNVKTMGGSYYYNEDGKLYNVQKGNKTNKYRLAIHSYTKKESFTFYSEVYYQNGSKDNVTWNNINYSGRIGPYLIADSTGGTSYHEEYFFKGGIERKYDIFSWGIEGSYLARIHYRKNDPRPKTNTSIISIKPGVSFRVKKYRLGLHVGVDRYEQNLNMRIYGGDNEKDYFYFLEGLGFYDKVFSGTNAYLETDYSSNAIEAGVQFVPVKKEGLFYTLKWLNSNTEQYFAHTYPSIYKQHFLIGKLGWTKQYENLFLQFDGLAHFTNGVGTERVYESIIVNEETDTSDKRLLTESDNYSLNRLNLHLSAFLSSNISDQIMVFGRAHIEKQKFKEEYLSSSEMRWQRTGWKVQPSIQVLFGHSYLECSLGYASYLFGNKEIIGIPDGQGNSDIRQSTIKESLILPNWKYKTADYSNYFISIKYTTNIAEKKALNLSAEYSNQNSDLIQFNSCQLNVGINF